MRILIVNPFLPYYGGASAAVAHLSAYLTSKGIDNAILTSLVTKKFIQETESLGLNIITKSLPLHDDSVFRASFLERIKFVMSNLLELRAYVDMHKRHYDIINPHNWPANWASILHRKPVIWMMNEPLNLYSIESLEHARLWLKIITNCGIMADRFLMRNYVDQICVNSYLTYRQAKRKYGVNPEVVFFGVDYDFYSESSPEDLEKIMGKYDLYKKFVVLTSGGLVPQKNQLASIKAIEAVRNIIPNVKLILAGGGEERYINMLRAYVKSKKLDSHVVFTGHLSKYGISNMYHVAHVGLYPTKEQGGLLAPFETLAAGTPVIISTVNGASELIMKYKLGIVTENYVNAVIEVYNNYELYKNMAQRAREVVKNDFSWDKYSERLMRIFEDVYNKRKR